MSGEVFTRLESRLMDLVSFLSTTCLRVLDPAGELLLLNMTKVMARMRMK